MADKAPEEKAYTMRDALKDAAQMLKDEFGDVDQRAAVALAQVLYGAHEKEQFLKQRRKADHLEFV